MLQAVFLDTGPLGMVCQQPGKSADARALDADVVLVAQTLSAGLPAYDIIVASVNVRHIARFVASDVWTNINP